MIADLTDSKVQWTVLQLKVDPSLNYIYIYIQSNNLQPFCELEHKK